MRRRSRCFLSKSFTSEIVIGTTGQSWSIHLPYLLAQNGTIAASSRRGMRLAKYWTEIVAQASNYDAPTTILCRRRPHRRPCGALLTIYFDTGNFDVLWFCPACDDNGRISGWEGTFWDNSDLPDREDGGGLVTLLGVCPGNGL